MLLQDAVVSHWKLAQSKNQEKIDLCLLQAEGFDKGIGKRKDIDYLKSC